MRVNVHGHAFVRARVCVCTRTCECACVRVCACVHAYVCYCVEYYNNNLCIVCLKLSVRDSDLVHFNSIPHTIIMNSQHKLDAHRLHKYCKSKILHVINDISREIWNVSLWINIIR